MNNIISAILGGLIALVGSFILNKFNYSDLFAKTVSSERIKWIKDMRNTITDFIVFLKVHQKSNNNYFDIERFEQLKNFLLLRLNPKIDRNSFDHFIRSNINKSYDERNTIDVDKLYKDCEDMLKIEWEKVKCEAQGYNLKSNKEGLIVNLNDKMKLFLNDILIGLSIYLLFIISLDYINFKNAKSYIWLGLIVVFLLSILTFNCYFRIKTFYLNISKTNRDSDTNDQE
jgi:hypothetical protein